MVEFLPSKRSFDTLLEKSMGARSMPRPRTIRFYRKRLPHWEVEDAAYFVTIRLHGSIPLEGEEKLRQLRKDANGKTGAELTKIERRIFATLEKWLDNNEGACHLRDPAAAEVIRGTLHYFQTNNIWNIYEYAIMPNHIHLLFDITDGNLWDTVDNFKSFTGKECNKVLNRVGKIFWQREWFDHWTRTHQEFEGLIEYIQQNPVKARLAKDYHQWPWGRWNDPFFTK
jgi:putative transposase